jgi:hypothetical protein
MVGETEGTAVLEAEGEGMADREGVGGTFEALAEGLGARDTDGVALGIDEGEGVALGSGEGVGDAALTVAAEPVQISAATGQLKNPKYFVQVRVVDEVSTHVGFNFFNSV